MSAELTWKQAIDKVLASSPTALHYEEIAEGIIQSGFRVNLGATPAATVNAQISHSIKHRGSDSPYLRVGKGTYTLRNRSLATENTPDLVPEVEISDELEEQYEIVTSFGMFWRRDAVEWVHRAKLLGMQQIGATPVDFHTQLGIYLLYDGREVIYVGRSTDRPIGRRLYEHTQDRLATRWDRFSWFGLRSVSEQGQLRDFPESYAATNLIPALEAILIEALEPRQNRKRGDDLAAVEFLQATDPEIERRSKLALIESMKLKI